MSISTFMNHFMRRQLHTSAFKLQQNYKLPKVMKKFLGVNTQKKKWYPDTPAPLPKFSVLGEKKGEHKRTSSRRVTVLNKLFMRHITDQLSSGEIAQMLDGKNFQITKLRIMEDFQLVNVYWVTTNAFEENNLETLLKDIAGILRHELSQLKLMGVVPRINFVKDRNLSVLMELDSKLGAADYGEDFKPTSYSKAMKSDFVLGSKLKDELLEKIRELEENDEIVEDPVPPISTCMFGLDREKILNKIIAQKQKSAAAWSRSEEPNNATSDSRPMDAERSFNYEELPSQKSFDKKDFEMFLTQRKILQRKAKQEAKVSNFKLEEFEEDNYLDPADSEFETMYEPDEETIVDNETIR